jgi:pimeloyl-ACP methyl ester carboxylesterase
MKDIEGHRFRLDVPQSDLDDLAGRLKRARLPSREPEDGAPWEYGTTLAYMSEFLAYWRDAYDWRAQEAKLNRFAQYRIPVGEMAVHAIVEPGSGPDPLPLVLSHGWPGSIIEFADMIEPLAHPERFGGDAKDAFTVVVPGLPGYGWSDPPKAPISPRTVGTMWHELMREHLGFERYAAHGSDWGAAVTSWLAFDHPQDLAAIHLTLGILRKPPAAGDRPPDAEESAYFERQGARMTRELGYSTQHGTRPQTLAFGLTDSPVGLAAWILEKFQRWSAAWGKDEPPPMRIDDLITNIMFHWLPGPAPAYWMYKYLVDGSAFILPPGRRVEIPSHFCLFPSDVSLPAPRQHVERSYEVASFEVAPYGGHFPGLDGTEPLIESLRAAFARHRPLSR